MIESSARLDVSTSDKSAKLEAPPLDVTNCNLPVEALYDNTLPLPIAPVSTSSSFNKLTSPPPPIPRP